MATNIWLDLPFDTSGGAATHVIVDNFPGVQPVSGTVTANQGTSPWVISGSITTSPNVNVHDGAGNTISSTGTSLNVDVTNTIPVSQSGTWNINNISGTISLPTGASTSALQTTGNTSLASIDSKIPSGLTVSSTRLLVDGSGVTQPVSGTVTANQGTTPWTIQGDSASGASKAGNPVQIGGVFNTTQPTVTTGQTVEAQSTARGALIVSTGADNFNINNISGTVSLPTGASTSANQTTLGSQTTKINDGTNTAAVKAASTAAVATDPALVVAISPNNSIQTTPTKGTLTNGSGHVTTANVFQTLFASNANRKYLFVENIDTNGGYLYLAFGASPTALTSIIIGPLGSFVMEGAFISTELVSISGTFTTDFCAFQA